MTELSLSRRSTVIVLGLLFAVSWALRSYQTYSPQRQWAPRSREFVSAALAGDWGGTVLRRHPGVTLMAIGGVSMRGYESLQARVIGGTPVEGIFDWAFPPYAERYGREMAIGVLGLGFALSALLVAITLALRSLGGWPLALTAAGLMLFQPYILARSRTLHVDVLLSNLMLLSALLVFISLERGQRRYLALSGVAGGLALLTKTPSLFLLPLTGLALAVHLGLRLRGEISQQSDGRLGWLFRTALRELVWPLALWTLVAGVVFAMWPAVWTDPQIVFSRMFSGTLQHFESPHVAQRFFLGKIHYDGRVGVLYYPVTMLFNSTFLMLPLVLAGLGLYSLRREKTDLPLQRPTFWLLVAYAVFYTVQMTLAAKKSERYVLPTHLSLEVLAAVGAVGVSGLLRQALAGRLRWLPATFLGSVVGLQGLVALAYAPDHSAHRNHLLGGNWVAAQVVEIAGDLEGVGDATRFMNGLPDAEKLDVGAVSPYWWVQQYLRGDLVYPVPEDADYYLVGSHLIQRDILTDEVDFVLDRYQDQPPRLVVSFDGVDYLWLYGPPGETVRVRRGGMGFVGLAWAWTLALAGGLVWAVRQTSRATSD